MSQPQRMKKPCTDEEKKFYDDLKRKACGQKGECKAYDSRDELSQKISNNSKCIDARRIETQQCYSDNTQHDVTPIDERKRAIENCKKQPNFEEKNWSSILKKFLQSQ